MHLGHETGHHTSLVSDRTTIPSSFFQTALSTVDEAERVQNQLDSRRLAAIVESSNDAILSKTTDGIITSWNSAATRLYGYRADEAIGQHISLLVGDDHRDELEKLMSAVAAGRSTERLETIRVRRDGTEVAVVVSVCPLFGDDGSVVGASTIAHDISEQKRAQQDLRRLAAIVESSNDAILSSTIEGTITSWNGAAATLFGYPAAEVLGRHISMLVPPSRVAEQQGISDQLAQGSAVERLETVRRRRDGAEIPVRLTVWPLFDDDGTAIGASTLAHDISEQIVAHRARAEAEGRFNAAFRRSAFGMVIADLDGYATSVNPAICELLGRSPDELLGQYWSQYAHPDDQSGEVTMLTQLRSGADSFGGERRYLRPDGSVIWLQVNVNVIRDDDDRPVYVMAQMQDITDRKRVEAEMEHRALHDGLTGLPNRAALIDRIDHALAATLRSGDLIGLLFLDLDGFKHVNDALGHRIGDDLLAEVGRRLASCVRVGDTVARFGGDEFAIVCERTNQQTMVLLANRVTETIAMPYCLDGHEVLVHASVGLTLNRPGSTSQSLLSEADAAMYRAKDAGQGNAALFGALSPSTPQPPRHPDAPHQVIPRR